MSRLLDDLLDMSRIARGKIELRTRSLDLREVLRHAIESTMPELRQSGVTLTHSVPAEPVPVVGDSARLQQVFVNLLSNAGRYSPRGAQIELELARDGDRAQIRVADNGDGIDPDLLPQVFDLFVQGDRPLDRNQGGLGIGLTLARDLVERHGGSIEAHSEGSGKGSTFTVFLPVAGQAANSDITQTGTGADTDFRGLRIVLVEDQADSRTALKRLLEIKGHQVAEAADGRAGIDTIAAARPDVAIVDIGLPLVDGYEVARQVRQDPALEDVYMIALSGYGTADDIERAHAAGFDRHLTKPASPNCLQEVLESVGRK